MKRTVATLSLAVAMCPAGAASTAAAAASAPTAKQLSALCDTCAVVGTTHTEQRKGKATGLGAVGGAVAGGVLGHQVGGGTGKTIATAGGAVAGGIAGHQLEKHLKKHTVWVTKVTMKDGKMRTFEYDHDPGLAAGAVVKVEGDRLVKP